MNRRHFVRSGGLLLGAALALPLLEGCSPATPRPTGGAPAPVAPPLNPVPPRTAPLTVAPQVADFARLTESTIVAPSFGEWLAKLEGADRAFMEGMQAQLTSKGWTDYSRSRVYAERDVFFYTIGNRDLLNNCTPFVVKTPAGRLAKGVMVEGPTAIGLNLAAHDWPAAPSLSPAAGLIPRAVIVDRGMNFQNSIAGPYSYRTAAGTLGVDYRADHNARTGVISLKAQTADGQVLLAKDYPLHWG